MDIKIISLNNKFLDEASELLLIEFTGDKKEAKEYLKERMKNGECFIAIVKDNLLGIATYKKKYSHRMDYLDMIVVEEKSRGKGIGRMLINKIIEISRKEQDGNKTAFFLSSTSASNKASQEVHRKLGFEVLGILNKLHYGEPEIFFGYRLK